MNAYDPRIHSPGLPNAIEAEQALLGALFLSNEALAKIDGKLTAEDFYEPLHRRLFSYAVEIIRQGKKATPPTMAPFFAPGETVGDIPMPVYLARLASGAVGWANAESYASAIVDTAVRRKLISVGQSIADIGFTAEPQETGTDLVARAQDLLFGVDVRDTSDGMQTAQGAADDMMRDQGRRMRPTVPVPLPQLREVMGQELEAGNLYGMLSGSGEGKTSMVLQIVRHAAEAGHPVLLLSYDQLWDQCLLQMVSQKLGIEHGRLKEDTRLQTREREEKWEAISDLRTLPMAYKKCSGRMDGSAQIAGYARRFLTTYAPRFQKVPLIVLDHVRKVKPKSDRDHEGRIAAEVNGVCKDIASDHDAVWLNLNQRSSSGAKRKNPRPIDADIYGGEMAREDYDGVFYLYRAWKYRATQLAIAADDREERDVESRFAREKWEEDQAELGALKVRFGDPHIRRRIRFEAAFTRYASMREEAPATLFED